MNARALLLLGPTASGKSALALALAQRFALEIVSLDSAQVYRGMDIGSAKPTAAERAAVPHHLIDIRDPAQPYSAADFLRDANHAIEDIGRRGKRALVVGGTMMYARVLREGIAELPAADPALRARLEQEAAEQGWPALHARLMRVDAPTAQRLAPLDRQRIARALEVHELAGAPLSALLRASAPAGPLPPTLALMPSSRELLHARIATRLDAMLAQGFLDEVRALRHRGDLQPGLPALRSVGYRQAWEHLEQGTPLGAFREAALAATRRLAKHQMTWLRSMGDAVVLDPFAAGVVERVAREVERVWG